VLQGNVRRRNVIVKVSADMEKAKVDFSKDCLTYYFEITTFDLCNRISRVYTVSQNGDVLAETSYVCNANGSHKELRNSDGSSESFGTEDDLITLMSYDALNRLVTYDCGSKHLEYTYDSDGQRTSKKTVTLSKNDGQSEADNKEDFTRYFYYNSKVLFETNDNGNITAVNTYGTLLNSRHVVEEADITSISYFYSAYGDVIAITDAVKGEKLATYEYDPFGELFDSRKSDAFKKKTNSVTYRGYEQDEETGLYYLNARHYDSETARFLTEDTYRGSKEDPLSLNCYVYCRSNPLRYVDPSGHFFDIFWDVFAVVVDTVNIVVDIVTGDTEALAMDTIAVAADLAAMAVPGVPATAGVYLRGFKASVDIVDGGYHLYKGAERAVYAAKTGNYWALIGAIFESSGGLLNACSGAKEASRLYTDGTDVYFNNVYKPDKKASDNGTKSGKISKNSGVGNPVEVAGRGTTGRNVPNSLNEQMAMHQILSNPLQNASRLPLEMKDSRWPASEGWVKMQSIVENHDNTITIIHFVYNTLTGEFDDFKFK